jgi:hypothetical protein
MTGALARIEARHLARSPLLWIGLALAAAFAALELLTVWPALAGDDLVAYRAGVVVAGGALLAGAWLGLRDQASGAGDLVAVTPTAAWRLWRARLAGVAVATAAGFMALSAGVLAVSSVRGGRGLPDLRLLADGMLAVVLGGWVGVAVGRLSGSRLVAVLAAPGWVAFCLLAGNWPGLAGIEPSLAVQRLSPLVPFSERSAEFGFMPDPLWPHLGYLLGLLLLLGVALLLSRRGDGQRLAARPALAAGLVGVVLVGLGGVGVVTLPHRLVVLGPDRADWRPVAEAKANAGTDPSWSYPDDGRARTCAGDPTLEVCVYPAYGQRLAQYVFGSMRPVAGLVAGLSGVPTRARMIPTQEFVPSACRGTEVQVGEPIARLGSGSGNRASRFSYASLYLGCAVGQSNSTTDQRPSDAQDAVHYWALLASGTITAEELRQGMVKGGLSAIYFDTSPEVAGAAVAMAERPVDQVRAELALVWNRLRAGTLPVAELPGPRP